MKLVFISNYYTHHQSELSMEFAKIPNVDYTFIQTEPMEDERKRMGWEVDLPPFVLRSYVDSQSYDKTLELIKTADAVIIGSAPTYMETLRLKTGKLTFKYSERVYKPAFQRYKNLGRVIKYFFQYKKYDNLYLLASSAYAPLDYSKSGLFKGKALKWGYFPKVIEYGDVRDLISKKESGSILWVARFLDLKHPEIVVSVAEKLKRDGYRFTVKMIGDGVERSRVEAAVKEKGLGDCVSFLGVKSPEQVRSQMEQSQIFLFTSDFNEGWGAVLNEAMNSGCAAVASHAAGSVPFLIDDGKNGLICKNCDENDFYKKIRALLDDRSKSDEIGKNAYETMKETWNARVAANRFIALFEKLSNGETVIDAYDDGPCEKAKILKNNWYK